MTATHTTRGKVTERMVVRWMREHGFPQADRIRRMGFTVGLRTAEDEGDVGMAPGCLAQVKALRPVNRAERAVPGWLAETEAQRLAAGADVALLVVRRDGTSDVGEWWAWLRIAHIDRLLDHVAGWTDLSFDFPPGVLAVPVRLLVADACRLLRAAGYGEPLQAEPVDLPSAEDVRGILRPEWVGP